MVCREVYDQNNRLSRKIELRRSLMESFSLYIALDSKLSHLNDSRWTVIAFLQHLLRNIFMGGFGK